MLGECFRGFRSVGGSALEVLEVLGECFGGFRSVWESVFCGFRSVKGVFWMF